MFNAATALNRELSPDKQDKPLEWTRLEYPHVDPQSIEALNALYRRRALQSVQLGGQSVTIKPSWQKKCPEIAAPWTLTFQWDEKIAELVVSEAIILPLLTGLDPSLIIDDLSPEHSALLLEHVLTQSLDGAESALGCSLSLQSAQKLSAVPGDNDWLVFQVEMERRPPSWCLLKTGPEAIPMIATGLDRISKPSPQMTDFPIPTRIRWAAVDLSLNELKSLMPGDIVLVDYHCSEHETAMAVIGNRLIAPVKAVPDGYQLLKAPRPLRDAEANWCLPGHPAQNNLLGEGTLNDIPMRVFAEFAQFGVSYSKLRDLKQGSIIGSGQPFNTHVELIVGNTRIGRGEPTTIGSGLGVRIVRQ